MIDAQHNGWTVEFTKNVRMYSHRLQLSKGGKTYSVACEDAPEKSNLVVMWPYELKLAGALYEDLLAALRTWAKSTGLKYKIYVSPQEYETNADVEAEQGRHE